MAIDRLEQIPYLLTVKAAKKEERARILAALEKLEHHGTWKNGTAIYWRADEVMRVVRGERDGN